MEAFTSYFERRAALLSAIGLALLFAIVVMLPLKYQRMDRELPYLGIPMFGPDQEVYYAARVQEVYDGFGSLGNAFYSAPKEQPYLHPPLAENVIARVGQILGLDAVVAFMLSKIILSATVFLAMAAFLYSVTSRAWVSIISTTVVLFAGALLSAPWDLFEFFFSSTFSADFLRYARAVNPQWSGTLFFLGLYFVSEWLKRADRIFVVGASVCFALLVYSYVYAWTYFAAATGLISVWYLIQRDRRRILDLGLFWLIGLSALLPYALHLYEVSKHPWYQETIMRFGLVMQHGPVIFGFWLAVFLVLGFVSKKIWPATWPLLPSLALAGVIAYNQHIITGQFIVPHHYHWYFVQPLASLLGVATVLVIGMRFLKELAAKWLAAAIIFFAVITGIVQQRGAFQVAQAQWGKIQAAAPVFDFMHQHLRAGKSVYSQNVHLLNLVPILTSTDVYYATNSYLSLTSDERARHSYFLDLWLQGVAQEQAAKEFPTTRRWNLSSRLHSIYYREAKGDYAKMPDEEVEENIRLYREFAALPLKEKLTKYPIDAVLTGPNDPEDTVWTQFLRCSEEVFASNEYGVRLMIPAGEPLSCL